MSLITAVIIVLIIIIAAFGLIYYFGEKGKLPDGVFKHSYDQMKQSIERKRNELFVDHKKLYENTMGYEYDETAKLAMQKAKKRDEMYQRNEIAGRATTNDAIDATETAFILGDLYRFNLAPNMQNNTDRLEALGNANVYYNRAINYIRREPEILGEILPIEHFIDRVEGFHAEMIGDNQRVQQHFDNVRTETDKQRAKSLTKKQYFAPKKVANDPQNVHDSAVVDEISKRFKKIKHLNSRENLTTETEDKKIGAIRAEIHQMKDQTKRRNALQVLNKIMLENSHVSSVGANEKDILFAIWDRINSKTNEERKENLVTSFIDSLANSMESRNGSGFSHVCTQGRACRIIDSLTLLDKNEKLSVPPKTIDMYRNEIMSKSYKILQDELKKAPNNVREAYNGNTPLDDESSNKIDNTFTQENAKIGKEKTDNDEGNENIISDGPNINSGNVTINNERTSNYQLKRQVDEFIKNTKNKIEETIRSDYPDAPESILNNLIKSAQTGVEY